MRHFLVKSVEYNRHSGEIEESEHWYDHLEMHIGWKSLGKILCGYVTQPGDTDGKPELQEVYELGKSI